MTLEELQNILLDIVTVLDKICAEADIDYTLFGGSMIGAVRHKGIIPWDDDIDIRIWYNDYQKLKKNLNEKLPSYLKLVEPEESCPYFYDFIPRIIDTRYTLHKPTEYDEYSDNIQNHPALDIFLASYSGNSEGDTKKNAFKLQWLYAMALGHRYGKNKLNKKPTSISEFLGAKVVPQIGKLYSMEKIFAKRKKLLDKMNEKKTDKFLVSNIAVPGFLSQAYDTEWTSEYIRTEFNSHNFTIESGYDGELTMRYGDYMTPEKDSEKYTVHFKEEN